MYLISDFIIFAIEIIRMFDTYKKHTTYSFNYIQKK